MAAEPEDHEIIIDSFVEITVLPFAEPDSSAEPSTKPDPDLKSDTDDASIRDVAVPGFGKPPTEPYDESKLRYDVTKLITWFVLLLMVLLVAVGVFAADKANAVADLIKPVLSPLMTVFAMVIAFYFSSKK